MMQPPDFGKVLSKDRFERVQRYLARGPLGAEDDLTDDPWSEVRWICDEFNCQRRLEFRMGWAVVVDESMIQWQGKSGPGGMPHLSYVKRKPQPLGLELKTLCDASTGMMMVIEIQEGKIRMARARFCREFPATTACTLRLCAIAGLGENSLVGPFPKRVVFADSWFASLATLLALRDKLGQFRTAHVLSSTFFIATCSPSPRSAFYWPYQDRPQRFPFGAHEMVVE